MTPTQIKLAAAGGLALLAWLLAPRAPARVTREIEIDANVYSDTFGEPMMTGPSGAGPDGWNPELRRLVEESAAAIRAHDAHAEDLY